MGSIGAPSFGFGWAPAISFNGDHEDCIANAYATPIPDVKRESLDEQDFLVGHALEAIRRCVDSAFGGQCQHRAFHARVVPPVAGVRELGEPQTFSVLDDVLRPGAAHRRTGM